MSGEDKTLRETVAEAISGNNDTTNAEATETKEGISAEGTAGETHTGGTPGYVSGIDISDIPEQDRPRIKELLTKKASLLENGYQGKFKEVADLKKEKEALAKLGLSSEKASEIIRNHIEQQNKPVTTQEKKDAAKMLDKLKDQIPPEQHYQIEQLRQAILEETNIKAVNEKLEKIEKLLGVYHQSAMTQREKQIESDLAVLSERYGKELVDKYGELIKERGLQNPTIPINKIFQYEVPDEEKEQAVLSKSNKKPLTDDKKKAITNSSSGVTASNEKVDVKGTSYADLLRRGIGK